MIIVAADLCFVDFALGVHSPDVFWDATAGKFAEHSRENSTMEQVSRLGKQDNPQSIANRLPRTWTHGRVEPVVTGFSLVMRAANIGQLRRQ